MCTFRPWHYEVANRSAAVKHMASAYSDEPQHAGSTHFQRKFSRFRCYFELPRAKRAHWETDGRGICSVGLDVTITL